MTDPQISPEQPEDPEVQEAEAFLRHITMEEAASYLRRGRMYAGMPVGQLEEQWTLAFKQWFRTRSPADQLVVDDTAAELTLRGLLPPHKTVEAELTKMQAELAMADRSNPNVRQRIQDYLDQKDKPKN